MNRITKLGIWVLMIALLATAAWAVSYQSLKFQYMQMGKTLRNTDASQTLTIGQSGSVLVCTNASGTSTVTIPEATASIEGVFYTIVQTADQDLTITTATANNNDFTADDAAGCDSVTLTGSNHKIGAVAYVIGVKTASSTWQWIVTDLNPEGTITPGAA